jgi:hypothetical protein
VLRSASPEGTVEKFSDLTFHGGPGTVVEFRLSGRDSLGPDCRAAGFSLGLVYGETALEYGIVWNPYVPEDAPYRPFIYGLDSPPWAFVKSDRDTRQDAAQWHSAKHPHRIGLES